MKPKLAVIGTGMAGMSAAFFLKDDYDITVFEKNNYIGGHTNTVYVEEDGKSIPIDTGFMVFNEFTYPLMCKLFNLLSVPYHDTSMSFSVFDYNKKFEYNGGSFADLFTQRKNFFSPRFWKMLIDIYHFGKKVPIFLTDKKYHGISLGDLIKTEGYGPGFTDEYMLPMTSAVWSTPHDEMLRFPARSLIRFLQNHGLTGIDTQHQWKTVEKGSETYKQRLIESFKERIKTNSKVVSVIREASSVKVSLESGETFNFDKVVLASHADETRSILKDQTDLEKKLLTPFEYQKNEAWLHTDKSVMPHIYKNWSSWNQVQRDGERFTIYYMNRLQPISKKIDYFININGTKFVDDSKVLKKITYHHPIFNVETEKAQQELSKLNDKNGKVFFCGAWFRYGFHEDALLSSVDMCKEILQREVL